MVTVPAVTAVMSPVAIPADAIPALLLDHVPPGVALASVDTNPKQAFVVPVIFAGSASIVITDHVLHVELTVYEILAVPTPVPVAMPLLFTTALVGLLVVHAPPVVALAKAVVVPWQTISVPVIALTAALTVTVVIRLQPEAFV